MPPASRARCADIRHVKNQVRELVCHLSFYANTPPALRLFSPRHQWSMNDKPPFVRPNALGVPPQATIPSLWPHLPSRLCHYSNNGQVRIWRLDGRFSQQLFAAIPPLLKYLFPPQSHFHNRGRVCIETPHGIENPQAFLLLSYTT